MKLSSETIEILENFSKINGNLRIVKGNVLQTVGEPASIFARATLKESFPINYGIYDLKQFLNTIAMFKDPDLNFSEEVLTIVDSADPSIHTEYYAADESILTRIPNVKQLPTPHAMFTLSGANSKRLERASSTLNCNSLRIHTDNGKILAVVYDKSGAIKNTFTIVLDSAYEGSPFDARIDIKKMTIVDGDYNCSYYEGKCVYFQNKDKDIEYLLSIEAV